jgi:predicted acyltransferase
VVGKPNQSAPDMDLPPGRQPWLDVLRGVAVAGMIVVNNPGSWDHVYWPLAHAPWHGWTAADLIFPLFLFIVGVSISFAFSHSALGNRRLQSKVLHRTLLLYALGVLITAFPNFDLSTMRITGVLQRIAVCYLFAVVAFRALPRPPHLLLFIAALLVVDYLLMALIQVPGCALGSLSRECNASGYIDRIVLGRHVGAETHDPEGLLTTIPAFATTLCGVAAGQWLRAMRCDRDKLQVLVAGGACCMATGLVGDAWYPINKSLWTSSYVLLTAGTSSLALAFCYALIRDKKIKAWALPFQVLGVNALAAFILSELLARVIAAERWWNLPHADGRQGADLRTFLHEQLFMPWAVPELASALWALAYLTLIIGMMTAVYRLHLRIAL